ncbi:TlpA family protein disulfide reductase [Saccharibacillus alkalitolerans]|uniref:Redoxin family protein n=1 Tax=Saccharibacillus alkalitolerans TaxID=2705290 RepID=A0ABX0F1T3_9BACL|nr:redoxin family protein [Saccharibacillus alkalitolerans]NGZ74410.1 redoxin family protein [Saccharibacillus alkalitolerans]
MPKTKKKWLPLLMLLSAALLLSACGQGPAGSASGSPAASAKPAPQFDLKDLNGSEVKLADYKGEKVYIKYWASWCSICLAGMDELNTLAGQDNDFKVISIVAPDFKGEKSEADFKKWFSGLDEENTTVLLDQDGKYAQQLGVRAYPTSFYIDSEGGLAKTVPGHNTNDVIASNFDAIP